MSLSPIQYKPYLDKILASDEFDRLQSIVGYDKAKEEVTKEFFKNLALGWTMVTATAIAVVVAAAAVTCGIPAALISGSVGSEAVTTGSGASRFLIRGSSAVGGGAQVGQNIPFWLKSILFGVGYSSGTVIGFNLLNSAIGGDKSKEIELMDLATKTDDYLYAMGLDDNQIASIREWYAVRLGLPSGSGVQTPTSTSNADKLSQFNSLFNQLLNSGVEPAQALKESALQMGWSPNESTVRGMYDSALKIQSQEESDRAWLELQRVWAQDDRVWSLMERADDDAWETAQRQHTVEEWEYLESQREVDDAYESITRGWSLDDRAYNLARQQSVLRNDDFQWQNQFYSVFDNLRARGMKAQDALDEAINATGFQPSDLVIEELLDEDNELLEEMMGVYQTSDVYDMIQTAIEGRLPADMSPAEELDEIDLKPARSPLTNSNRAYKPYYGSGSPYVPNDGGYNVKKSEENMAGIHRGSNGKWYWNGTNKPVNGGRSSGGYRKNYTRSSYRRRF